MAEGEQIKCPHCGQTYAVRPEQWAQYNGRTINCTKCGQAFTVSAPAPAVAPAPAAAPPMPSAPLQPQPPAVPYTTPPGFNSPYAQGPVAPTMGNGFALASLICGIVGFCTFGLGSLLGIIFGIVGLTKTRDPRVGGKGSAVAGITLGGIGLLLMPLLIAILLPSLGRAREAANRVKCKANMQMLGQAMIMYANSNGDHFPDKLEDVLQADPTLPPGAFVCPSDDKSPPSNSSIQTEAHEIASGQHCSYIYVGEGLTASSPSNAVLLYDAPADHQNEGMNVLFVDGHAEWVGKAEAQSILSQQASGDRPIKVP